MADFDQKRVDKITLAMEKLPKIMEDSIAKGFDKVLAQLKGETVKYSQQSKREREQDREEERKEREIDRTMMLREQVEAGISAGKIFATGMNGLRVDLYRYLDTSTHENKAFREKVFKTLGGFLDSTYHILKTQFQSIVKTFTGPFYGLFKLIGGPLYKFGKSIASNVLGKMLTKPLKPETTKTPAKKGFLGLDSIIDSAFQSAFKSLETPKIMEKAIPNVEVGKTLEESITGGGGCCIDYDRIDAIFEPLKHNQFKFNKETTETLDSILEILGKKKVKEGGAGLLEGAELAELLGGGAVLSRLLPQIVTGVLASIAVIAAAVLGVAGGYLLDKLYEKKTKSTVGVDIYDALHTDTKEESDKKLNDLHSFPILGPLISNSTATIRSFMRAGEAIENVGKNVKNSMFNMSEDVSAAFRGFNKSTLSTFDSIKKTVSDKIDAFIPVGTNITDALKDTIKTLPTKAGNAITQTIKTIREAPGDLGTKVFDWNKKRKDKEALKKYDPIIEKAAKMYGQDPNRIRAMIMTESGGNPLATSKAKDKYGRPNPGRGLMQLTDATARDLGVTNSYDPEQNIMGGVKYLAKLSKTFKGDIEKATAAYNAGPNRRELTQPGKLNVSALPKETQDYIPKVGRYKEEFDKESKTPSIANSTPNTATNVQAQIDSLKASIARQQQALSTTSNPGMVNTLTNSIQRMQDNLAQLEARPKAATGGFLTKGGLAELHPAEIVAPISKFTDMLSKTAASIAKPVVEASNRDFSLASRVQPIADVANRNTEAPTIEWDSEATRHLAAINAGISKLISNTKDAGKGTGGESSSVTSAVIPDTPIDMGTIFGGNYFPQKGRQWR